MKEEKQVQTIVPEMPVAQEPEIVAEPPIVQTYKEWLNDPKGVYRVGELYVLPHIKIGRNQFVTKAGDTLYGYFVPVMYHGEQFNVRLSTPLQYNPNTKKNNLNRGGYVLLDALYKTCKQLNLALQFVYYPDSKRLRTVNYFVCGYDEFDEPDYLPVDVDTASSESVLRSCINRLRRHYELKLPEF